MRRRVGRCAQLQLGVKRGHQREELRQLLVGAGPEVVDHAGQARGEDVHAVHEPQQTPAHLQALLARLAEDSEAEVAVVALLDRGAHQPLRGFGAALALALGAAFGAALAMGMGLSDSLPSASLLVPCRCPRRALRAAPCRQESPSWLCSAAGSGSRSRPL